MSNISYSWNLKKKYLVPQIRAEMIFSILILSAHSNLFVLFFFLLTLF